MISAARCLRRRRRRIRGLLRALLRLRRPGVPGQVHGGRAVSGHSTLRSARELVTASVSCRGAKRASRLEGIRPARHKRDAGTAHRAEVSEAEARRRVLARDQARAARWRSWNTAWRIDISPRSGTTAPNSTSRVADVLVDNERWDAPRILRAPPTGCHGPSRTRSRVSFVLEREADRCMPSPSRGGNVPTIISEGFEEGAWSPFNRVSPIERAVASAALPRFVARLAPGPLYRDPESDPRREA
jgi:hypothetical protein